MQKLPYVIVIPARLKSTRLPNKPLVDILGKTMIQRTYERCLLAASVEKVVVATDSADIFNHCKQNNMNVEMTSENCLTGTDRVAEIAQKLNADYFINVQGDEPLINPNDIKKLINCAEENNTIIYNGFTEFKDDESYFSVSVPKVVFNNSGKLLYMSRAPIPGNKSGKFEIGYRQVCIYGFPKNALIKFSIEQKTKFEALEDIEILRFLELGFDVQMLEMSNDSIPVDHPEDVQKVVNRLKSSEDN